MQVLRAAIGWHIDVTQEMCQLIAQLHSCELLTYMIYVETCHIACLMNPMGGEPKEHDVSQSSLQETVGQASNLKMRLAPDIAHA